VSFVANDAGTARTACFPLVAGDGYTFSARMKTPSTSVFRGACELFLNTGANCGIAASNDSSTRAVLFSTVGNIAWHNVQMTVTIPPGVVSGYVNCGPGGSDGSGTFFFDQVLLVRN
jgi:hypothetical protein